MIDTATKKPPQQTIQSDPLSFEPPKEGGNWFVDDLMQSLKLPELEQASPDNVDQPTFGQLMAGADQQGAALASLATIAAEAVGTSGVDHLLDPETLDRIVEARMSLRGVRRSREMIDLADMGLWDSLKHGVSHPLTVMLPSAWQSIRSQMTMFPAIGGAAAAGGPIGLGIATGGASAWIEGTATFFDSLEQAMNERGMQAGSAADWRKALSDPKIFAAARSKAVKSGIAVGVFDGLSAGVLGKATSEASGGMLKKAMTAAVEATAIDAPVGAMGETTKQMWTEGRITSPADIAAEMFAGLPMGGLQVAGGVLARRGTVRMSPREQLQAKFIADTVALRHAEDMATPPTADEARAQLDPPTEAAIDTLSSMKIDDLAAAAIAEGIDVPTDITEADKPALIAKIMDEADKKLEMEADDIEEAGTVTPEERAAADEPRTAAGDIAGTMAALGAAAQASGQERTAELVAKQGYVGFKNPAAIDRFAEQNPSWNRTEVDGETRFSPPPSEAAHPSPSPSIQPPSAAVAPADQVGTAASSDRTAPIEIEFPKKKLADMIEEKWPGITGRIGAVDQQGMGDAAERVVDTAEHQGDDTDRFIARVFKMDKEGQLSREEIGSLVGINTDDIEAGDTFGIDGETAEVTASDDKSITFSIKEPDVRLPIGDGEDMIEPGAVTTFTIPRGQTIPMNQGSHTLSAETNAPQPVAQAAPKEAKPTTGADVANMPRKQLHALARKAGMSESDIRKHGDEWLRENLAKFVDSERQQSVDSPKSKIEAIADKLDNMGKKLMQGTPSTLKRGSARGSRSGSTTLYTLIAGATLRSMATSIRYGATTYKAVKQIVERVVGEIGNRNLKNQVERITRDTMKLLRQTKGDQSKIDSVIAAYSAKAQERDRKRTGVGMKEQIRETTGAGMRGREEKVVSEQEALKARMKGQVLAGRVSFAAGKVGEKMDAEVKKVDPKKVKVGFLKTFGSGWNTLFKDTKPFKVVQDIARFLKETHKGSDGQFRGAGPVTPETIELALNLTSKKYNALTEDEANSIREMVRMFKAEHNTWNKALGDAQAKSMAQAAATLAADMNKRPELDASLGTAKSRKGVRAFLDYRATARTIASAMGKVASRFFHDNFVKPQEKMYERIMRVHDDMHATFAEHGITTKAERDAWIDDHRLKIEQFKLPDGRTISLTRSEAMSLYALSQRSAAEDVMTRNGVKSKRHKGLADSKYVIAAPEAQTKQFQEAVAKADERVQQAMKAGDTEQLKIAQSLRSIAEDRMSGAIERYVTEAIRAITGQLTQTEKDIVDTAIESIQTNITPDANAVSELLFGSPIFNESDYTMRMLIDRAGTWDNTDVRQILDLQTFFTAWIENAGFTKELQKHKNPVMLGDFFSEIDAQARDMSVYADLLIPIRDARMLLTAKPVQQAIRSRFGTNVERNIVRTLAKLTGMQRNPVTQIEMLTSIISRNIASSLLGIRDTVFMANRVAGSITLQTYLSPQEQAYYAEEAAKAIATLDLGGFSKAEKAILAKLEANGYMAHRWKELDSYRLAIPGLEERDVTMNKHMNLTRAMRRIRRIADFTTRHMRYAERRNAVAAFNSMVKAGETEENAIRRVADITRQTQNPVTALEESPLIDDIKTNPFAAAIWLFAGQGEILANMVMEPLARGDRKAAAKAAFFIAGSIAALVGARELLRFARRGFKKEKDKRKQKDTGDSITQFLSETLNLIAPGLGDFASATIRLARHKPVQEGSIWQENLTGPLSQLAPDIISAIGDGKGDKWKRIIRNTLRLIDTTTGLPSSNAAGYVQSLIGQ